MAMEQAQLEKFKTWFNNYVAGFYSDDEFEGSPRGENIQWVENIAKTTI